MKARIPHGTTPTGRITERKYLVVRRITPVRYAHAPDMLSSRRFPPPGGGTRSRRWRRRGQGSACDWIRLDYIGFDWIAISRSFFAVSRRSTAQRHTAAPKHAQRPQNKRRHARAQQTGTTNRRARAPPVPEVVPPPAAVVRHDVLSVDAVCGPVRELLRRRRGYPVDAVWGAEVCVRIRGFAGGGPRAE